MFRNIYTFEGPFDDNLSMSFTFNLPESHNVVRCPADDEAHDQDPGHLDGLVLANHAMATDQSSKYFGILGSSVYHDDDGGVAPNHDQEGDEEGHGEHKQKVEKFLGKTIRLKCIRQKYLPHF